MTNAKNDVAEDERFYRLAWALRANPKWERDNILRLFLATPCPTCGGPNMTAVSPDGLKLLNESFNENDPKWRNGWDYFKGFTAKDAGS